MSELNEKLWAVLSERGCEASGLTYMEAAAMMRRLAREKISGLCVISSDAGNRVTLSEGTPLQRAHLNGTRKKR
jgi:hypothetical protein